MKGQIEMAWNINGFGTIYYGNCEKTSDGSYVTTEWLVILFLPILPLGSYRVRPVDEGSRFSLVSFRGNYWARKIALKWGQILRTYLAFYGGIIMSGVVLGIILEIWP